MNGWDDDVSDEPEESHKPVKPRQSKRAPKPAVSAVEVIKKRTFSVSVEGARRKLTAELALKQSVLRNAFQKRLRDIDQVLKWIEQRELALPRRADSRLPKFKFRNQTPKDVDEAIQLLGIAAAVKGQHHSGGRPFMQLQAKFVDHALSRPQVGKLTPKDVRAIKQQTLDAGSVAWPEGEE
ncbi:MAG: hypothetical protein V4530_02015 [Pseudomonadota bacterium]